MTSAPFLATSPVGAPLEVFHFPMFSLTFGGEPRAYRGFAVLVAPGASPLNPANWLSFDDAPFTKN